MLSLSDQWLCYIHSQLMLSVWESETLNSVGDMDPPVKGNINWFITMDRVTLFYCLHYLVKTL